MNLWDRLFNKTPTSEEIRVQLKEVEREQKKKRRDLDQAESAKNDKIQQAVAAKKKGKQEMLRDIFRQMRQMEIDNGHLNAELRRLSLSKIALSSFVRKIEMLEKRRDRKSLQNLILRFRESSIQQVIDKAEVDDDTFGDILNEILGEEELSAGSTREREDAGFADFDRTIAEMAKSEETVGDDEELAKYATEINRAIKAEKPQDRES